MVDDSTLSARNVRIFDGTNFQGWTFQIRALLITNYILDVVDGTRQMPANRESTEAKMWINDNAKAMFVISSSIEYSGLEPLLITETAKEMWDKLCQIHEQ